MYESGHILFAMVENCWMSCTSLEADLLEVAGDGERSVVLSSHRLEDVARITDQLLVLNKGQVIQAGPTDALVDDQETLEERLVAWGAAG